MCRVYGLGFDVFDSMRVVFWMYGLGFAYLGVWFRFDMLGIRVQGFTVGI